MNIRTETPETPQPVGRVQNETAPPPPRVTRRNVRPPQPKVTFDRKRRRGSAERPVPRPSSPQVSEIPTPSRPLVRTAPPVEERPELQRSEQQKFSNWQQQRPAKSCARAQLGTATGVTCGAGARFRPLRKTSKVRLAANRNASSRERTGISALETTG